MTTPAPERDALRAAVERLEEVTAALSRPGAGAEELTRLAEEALELSAAVAERVPRALREAESEAEGT